MGREAVLKKLKSKGIALLVCGIFAALIGLLMLMATFHEFTAAICFLAILIGGIALIYFGIDNCKGENSTYIKKRPGILELADDLENTKQYEDDFIIVSEKALASKKDVTQIAALCDVLGIYERIQRQNGIVVSHTINLEMRNGKSIALSVYAKKKATKEDVLLTISGFCPNAMVGYTGEMLEYVEKERKTYKEAKI